jgi:hypothetical protein
VSGQVLGFVRSAHQVAFELLPWFVNGSLDESERASVEQHLHECAACRRELEWLRQLSSAYVQSEPAVDADRAFARIAPQLQPQDARGGSGGKATWGRLRALFAGDAPWLKWAVAMQLGVVVALGFAIAVRGPTEYRGLGIVPTHGLGSLIVVFDPGARESEVRRLLRDIGARVVDGPTAANGYVLELSGGAQTPAAALARLRSDPVVLLAEPLQAEPAR